MAAPAPTTRKPSALGVDEIEDIKQQANTLAGGAGALKGLYDRYEEVYFMTGGEKPRGTTIDENDWKVTVSPNGRNAVTGMKRLLDTSEVHVKVTINGGETAPNSDTIEDGLLRILTQSGIMRRARIEKDLNLSAVLYGPAVLAAESVQDLLTVQTDPERKKFLEQIARRTPFLLRAITPKESFSRWGEFGMNAHLRKFKMTGANIQEAWGAEDLARDQKYTVNDWQDRSVRVAWVEGRSDALIASRHNMPSMNIAARFAGGTSLFDESDKQSQSFLYAHTKGEWDKRENLFWTYLFTALYSQGLPGPLLIVDPDSLQPGQETVHIDFTGGVRKIIGKATATNFPVIDGDTLRIKEFMDAINSESTIYKQTLGENISGTTFSGLAMLSSAGQLPLEDPKEAIGFTFRDIFQHILERIKLEGIDNPWIKPQDIPDEYEIEVTLEPKLPQDNLRNAQVATALGPLVSDEWKRENLLQINDSDAMTKQVLKEQMLNGMIAAMMQDPNQVQQMIQTALNQRPPQIGGGGATAPTTGNDGAGPAQNELMAQGGTEAQPMTAPQEVPA